MLYGKRALLGEDPGCIAYGNPAHAGWYRQTLSHSTVVVNGKSQKACTGKLQFAAFGDGLGLCSTRADDAYPGVRLRRAMALVGDLVIDVFTCEAKEEATFDWVYHNRGEMTTTLAPEALAEAPEGDGHAWAKEWRACAANQSWGATWRTAEGPGVMLAQTAGDGGRELLTAVGMGNPTKVKNPFVVSRVRGRSAVYCSALAIFDGEPPAELSVRALPVTGGTAEERAAAVEATRGGARDVLLINPAGGEMQAEGLRLVGQGALLHYEAGKLAGLVVVGDARVYVGDAALSVP